MMESNMTLRGNSVKMSCYEYGDQRLKMKQKELLKQTLFHLSKIQLLNLAWSQSYLCFFLLWTQ